MIVGFFPTEYIAFERDEQVQVCVIVQTSRGGILRPFTIVLFPGEGNNNQY